jgi:hypothetical protein
MRLPPRAAFYFGGSMARKPKVIEVAERTEICRECRFAHFGDEVITCRRHSPIPVFDISEGEIISTFPITAPDVWCGDFGPKLSS